MSLSINNNITSLNAWRNLKQTDSRMSSTMEKLSSGLRINRAADDPAGLVISEKMRAQLVGLDAAVKNSEKAINMVQTAEAALDKVQSLLDKMRQLALDSANSGVNDSAMLQANQDELDEAIASITRIANYTQFGTKKLLDGSLGAKYSSAGGDGTFTPKIAAASFAGITDTGKSGTLSINVSQNAGKASLSYASGSLNITTTGVLADAASFTINGVTFNVASGTSIADVRSLINGKKSETGVEASATGTYGLKLTATQYGSQYDISFTSSASNLTTAATNHKASVDGTAGKDMKATLTFNGDGSTITFDQGKGLNLVDGSGNTIILSDLGSIATGTDYNIGSLTVNKATFQVGANENQTVSLTIQSLTAVSLGLGATYTNASGNTVNVTAFANLDQLKAGGALTNGVFVDGTADQIAQAIGVIDEALDEVSTVRGQLGAIQADNLQVQLDSLRVAYENLQASESTIRDTDMTLEMAQFTKYQIMMQAGTAMLAQANQIPNNILQLLR